MSCSAAVNGRSTHSFAWRLDANFGISVQKLGAEVDKRVLKSASLADVQGKECYEFEQLFAFHRPLLGKVAVGSFLIIVDKLCIKYLLLRCNDSRSRMPRLSRFGFLPTMTPQLSQLPKIVGSGRV